MQLQVRAILPAQMFGLHPWQQMTRMRDAAVQLLVASSASRDSLAQHNRLLVLELEEARARIRVLQVWQPRFVSCMYCVLTDLQHAVVLQASVGQENVVPIHAKSFAAHGRGLGASTLQHQQQHRHSSFTSSPALLLPLPHPTTPTPAPLPLHAKSSHKRIHHGTPVALSPPAAAASAAAHTRSVVSPLKASLVVQPAARVASPAEVARVAAAAAVAVEQVSRAGLSLPQLRSPGHDRVEVVHRRQEAAEGRLQGSTEAPPHAAAAQSHARPPLSPTSHAIAAAESASRLLHDLDSSGGGHFTGGAAVTSKEQLLAWMKVCITLRGVRKLATLDAVLQEVEAGVGDISHSSDD